MAAAILGASFRLQASASASISSFLACLISSFLAYFLLGCNFVLFCFDVNLDANVRDDWRQRSKAYLPGGSIQQKTTAASLIFNLGEPFRMVGRRIVLVASESKKRYYPQVSPSGWSEGECRGRNGWFPSAYVERRQRLPNTNGTTDFY